MDLDIEELMGYICDNLCVHAAEDSDYLIERCEECKADNYYKQILSLIKNKGQIISDVFSERARQDEKWGKQNHTAYVWASIIGEEYGEMCKAINEFGFNPTPEREHDIYTETIQTMASCMAMLECMQRNKNQIDE